MASEEDLERLRAAAVQMALDGNPKAALGIAAIHDAVKKAKEDKDTGKDTGKKKSK